MHRPVPETLEISVGALADYRRLVTGVISLGEISPKVLCWCRNFITGFVISTTFLNFPWLAPSNRDFIHGIRAFSTIFTPVGAGTRVALP